jgi:transcriptional regulator with XRE-family HTH domain
MLNDKTDPINIAARLKSAIAAAKVPKTALATACGVSDQAVTGWTKTGRISKKNLPTIAKALQVSVHWLLTGEESAPALPPNAANEDALSRQEQIILELFRDLTDNQKAEAVRSLEAQKQQNDTIWEQLSKIKAKKAQ